VVPRGVIEAIEQPKARCSPHITIGTTGALMSGFESNYRFVGNNTEDDRGRGALSGFGLSLLLAALLLTPMSQASTITRTSSYTYDSASGLLTTETAEPTGQTCNGNNTSCTVTTTYAYDPVFGNNVSTTVQAYGAAGRTVTKTYDANGEFIVSDTNPLKQRESWTYDSTTGKPTSHTDLNSHTTYWSYDTFGRVTQELRPDLTRTVYTYSTTVPSNGCINGVAFSRTSVEYAPPPNNTTQIGPQTATYYDSLSREVAVVTQGFDGSLVEVDTQYDRFGNVSQTSRPYFASAALCAGAAARWQVNTYDTLNRTKHVTQPNGGTLDYTYHALTSSLTNDHNQTTTTTLNAQGLKAGVKDAGGYLTQYFYDAEGDLTLVIDASTNRTTYSYDIRGHRIASQDPDMGNWTYVYDGFGQLISQTDANGNITTIPVIAQTDYNGNAVNVPAYDMLGRLLARNEVGQYSIWSYDGSNGVGWLAEAKSCTSSACTTVISDRTYSYDNLSRPTGSLIKGSYAYSQTYDANGRPSTLQYPSGTKLQYVYNSLGYQNKIQDATSGTVYWTVSGRDAEMHPVTQLFGNGTTQSNSYDANTGFLLTVRAGASDGVASFDYHYDSLGNLIYRSDARTGIFEYSCYDPLNRLTQYAVGNGVTSCSSTQNYKAVTYDPIGNITSKSDVGTYSYNAPGSTRPHAVASIMGAVNGMVNPTYGYDNNGNMLSGAGRAVNYTAFNMIASINNGGSTTVTFTYDGEHQRITETQTNGSTVTTTTYLNDPSFSAMADVAVSGGGDNLA